MAESLVGKIVSNAGKQWNRNTVADGTWLNTNTIQKLNQNDKTLAEAIESVSAEMGQFTPEITPSAWPCAANKTIQTIEQNADGSLNVIYQPIETSSTSDDSLWSWFKQDAYDNVLATYKESEEDINHVSGELSENLTIPAAGIYDIKIEVLYEPTQSTINNKLDIVISKSTSIDDALYQTFILFDDSLIEDTTSNPQRIDVQSEWITGIIKLDAPTALKFLIKGESAQGRYKLNNIYINSIGCSAGPEGPQVPIGPTGPAGPQGPSGEPGKDGADGKDGISPTVSTSAIPGGNRVTFNYDDGTSTKTASIDVMNGRDGASYTFDSTTLSGNGNTEPFGVNTNYFATQTWVDQQGFLKNTDLTNYATKSYTDEASANALSEAKTWVQEQKYAPSAWVDERYAKKTDVRNEFSATSAWALDTFFKTSEYFYAVSGTDSSSEYFNWTEDTLSASWKVKHFNLSFNYAVKPVSAYPDFIYSRMQVGNTTIDDRHYVEGHSDTVNYNVSFNIYNADDKTYKFTFSAENDKLSLENLQISCIGFIDPRSLRCSFGFMEDGNLGNFVDSDGNNLISVEKLPVG